jgi:hypothetical protein
MTAETLKSYTAKDLAEMARKRGVEGWRSMRKEQLVKALLRTPAKSRFSVNKAKAAPLSLAKTVGSDRRAASLSRTIAVAAKRSNGTKAAAPTTTTTTSKRPTSGVALNGKQQAAVVKSLPPVVKPKESAVARRLQSIKSKLDQLKNLGTPDAVNGEPVRDRLVVMVRDPYWLHAHWELSRQGVSRAQAAIGQEWHCAKPVLRLLEVSEGGTTSAAEKIVRDIEIHGGVNNWYVDVRDPPKSYRLDVGYLAPSGKMFVLARSNVVNTPKPGIKDAIDENWTAVAEDYEKIYAMSGGYAQDGGGGQLQELFEERLRRPMGSPMVTQYGSGADALMPRRKPFNFELDAELIVYGVSEPDAHITLQGDPVKLRSDGTFTVRFSLPNCRQVIPAVACSANGLEQRTIVLAVERNTKVMEPLVRDAND